jgi:hypothetical protein
MRQFIAAAALATGLAGLWAVLLPLAAQPAWSAAAPALSEAMLLCRGPNGIDRACVAALAQSMVLDAAGNGANRVAQHVCHVDHTTLASLARGD